MRDFRDAKAMAQTIRAALAANDLKITISQSLELIAKAFGAADWNTLSAAINSDAGAPLENTPAITPLISGSSSSTEPVGFSSELVSTLHRAVVYANQRKHGHATVEHLLLSLADDQDVTAVMQACNVDLQILKDNLVNYLDTELKSLMAEGEQAKPTAGFQRVIQRAVIHVQASGRRSVNGAQVLVAIFSERESRAAHLLDEQGMNRADAVNFMIQDTRKSSGGEAAA